MDCSLDLILLSGCQRAQVRGFSASQGSGTRVGQLYLPFAAPHTDSALSCLLQGPGALPEEAEVAV